MAQLEHGEIPVVELKISILGGGDFGGALGRSMINKGLKVTFGRRKPTSTPHRFFGDDSYTMTTYEEAIKTADIIVVAVPKHVYENLPLEKIGCETD